MDLCHGNGTDGYPELAPLIQLQLLLPHLSPSFSLVLVLPPKPSISPFTPFFGVPQHSLGERGKGQHYKVKGGGAA